LWSAKSAALRQGARSTICILVRRSEWAITQVGGVEITTFFIDIEDLDAEALANVSGQQSHSRSPPCSW
jgi:hypothetical protein